MVTSVTREATPEAASKGGRPLRADARRNRERVLEAARACFAQHGLDAQVDDIARAAKVGVGTVYRHFPTKEALIEALMVDSFQMIAAQATVALEIEDPWEAFASVLRRGAEIMAADRALSEVFASIPGAMAQAMPTVEGLQESMELIMGRAQEAGVLREDAMLDDVPMIMCGIGSATKKEHRCPASWRRHLGIVLDGLRASSASERLPS
jgi:AcrR family transcriptional regulator